LHAPHVPLGNVSKVAALWEILANQAVVGRDGVHERLVRAQPADQRAGGLVDRGGVELVQQRELGEAFDQAQYGADP
jgi:hypothetical protein